MSLQVWLPLTKDLRNQGLNNVSATNNGATYSSTGGKLGGCYNFTTSSYQKIGFPYSLANYTEFTVCVWVKPISTTITGCLFTFTNPNDYWQFVITSGNSVGIRDNSSGETGTRKEYTLGSFIANTWTHLAISYNKGVVKIYKDGVLFSTNNTGGSAMNNYSGTNAAIGESVTSSSSYYFAGSVNDFRVYDHCLSPIEVKDLSRGLVLHYTLNDKYCESVTNLASTVTGGWNNSGNCTRLFNDTSLDSSKPTSGPVISIKITTAGNCALTCGTTGASYPSKTLTFSIWCYLSGPQEGNVIYIRSTKTDGNVGSFEYNGSADPRNWPLNKWIRLEKTITTASDATTFYFCTYANILNRYIALNGWQIEEKSHASPWTPPGTTRAANIVEYDCSGLCNNGIKNNLPTYSSDTAKYNVSTYLDGTNQTIQLPNLSTLIQDGVFTFSIWFKKETDKWSSKGWETIFGGPSGFEFQSKSGSTNSPLLYAYSWGKGTKAYTLDEWHHSVMVRTTEGTTFYLDGEQAFTGTAGSIPSGNYFLGSWSTTSSQNYKGFMGDARIYATALSADDVLALYNKKI